MKLAVVLVLAFVAHPAFAGEAQEAKQAFDEGVKKLEAKDYAGAAHLFERSVAIKEALPPLFNLAVAYRGLGRYKDAKTTLDRFVALVKSGSSSEEALARAHQLIDDLKKRLARLKVHVSGGATRVTLDEKELAKKDGAYTVELDPGRYQLAATREGHQPAMRTIEVGEGTELEVALDASLKPIETKIVEASPPPKVAIVEPAPRVVESSSITGEWWFWAGIGAVVVAGTLTGVALALGDCGGGSLEWCGFGH